MAFRIKIRDKGFRRLSKEAKRLTKLKATTGVFADKGSDMVTIVATNEFGTDRAGANNDIVIPERSIFRSTADDDMVMTRVSKKARMVWTATHSAAKTMAAAGVAIADEIRKKITTDVPPENAPSTIKRKGAGKTTWVDTGRVQQSIASETRDR